MATRWSDDDIAATLNRMALSTGQGMTWNASRVGAYRRTAGIHGYESAAKDGRCLWWRPPPRRACRATPSDD
jgi:hypothetical protein